MLEEAEGVFWEESISSFSLHSVCVYSVKTCLLRQRVPLQGKPLYTWIPTEASVVFVFDPCFFVFLVLLTFWSKALSVYLI